MKKILAALVALFVLPMIFANDVGVGIGVDIETEDFEPEIWLCDNRVMDDDPVEWGRLSPGDAPHERNSNYAFEGESIAWKVLVMDKNGINKISDVYATIGPTQGAGNDIEVNCVEDLGTTSILSECNARIDEENITTFDSDMMRYYDCELTVETPASMYDEHWVTVEVEDLDGLTNTIDENEYWFFNPIVALSIDGSLTFSDVRPGTSSYSETLLVENDADDRSGVVLDMFIAGTNFYDSSPSGAMCPTTNELSLTAFSYYVVNGAWSSFNDGLADGAAYDAATTRARDAEGYLNIQYGDHFDRTMYDEAEILQANAGSYGYDANLLSPGAEMALTFKLDLPEPCNGDFDTGSIFFFGEAI